MEIDEKMGTGLEVGGNWERKEWELAMNGDFARWEMGRN